MPQSSDAIPFSQRWRRHGWWVAGVGAVWLAAWVRVPAPECVFRKITGLPCPLCGSTRAFRALAHGDWGTALWISPLACLLALGVTLWALGQLAALAWPGRRWPLPVLPPRWRGLLFWLSLAALLANWAYRLGTGQR